MAGIPTDSRKTQRVNLRTTERQAAPLRRAAETTDHTLADFIVDSAEEDAHRVLTDPQWFTITDAQFTQFVELLDTPLPSNCPVRHAVRSPIAPPGRMNDVTGRVVGVDVFR